MCPERNCVSGGFEKHLKITYWWDLLGQVHILRQDHFTLLQRTLQVHVPELLTQVDSLFDQGDEAPLHYQVHISSLFNSLLHSSFGGNSQLLPPRDMKSVSNQSTLIRKTVQY
jgi:hypothetical protein